MRFYTQQHQFYCGIDLHARTMYLCILNRDGAILVHRNMPAGPAPFLKAIAPYREDVVVCVACLFTWYWLADLCAREGLPCVLGHASLTWAFSEAAVLCLRNHPAGQKYLARFEKKHGKGQALTVLAHQLARAVYDMLKRATVFDMPKCLNGSGSGAGEPNASLDAHGLSLASGALTIALRQRTRRNTEALWP